jgi:hypothetical protein
VQKQTSSGATLIHVINYAGQRNGRYDPPPLLHGLSLGVIAPVAAQAHALVSGETITGVKRSGDGRLWFDLPPVETFEVIRIERL